MHFIFSDKRVHGVPYGGAGRRLIDECTLSSQTSGCTVCLTEELVVG